MLSQSFRRLFGAQPRSRSFPGLFFVCSVCLLLARPQSAYSFAIAASGTIDLRGNNLAADSFDSGVTNYPGYWTNTLRAANGDVITEGGITNSTLNLGTANIAGHVLTGPTGSWQIGPNGSVGDLAWVDAPTYGIEPGWYANDLNVAFRDVTIPNVSWLQTSGGQGGAGVAPDGNTYAHIFTSAAFGGFYTISDSGDIYVGTNVNVTIKVLSSVGTFAPSNLHVAGTGTNSGKFVAYIDCTNLVLGTDWPQSGLAANKIVLGTTNCTSVNYKGNGDFVGVIYAPEANFQLAGGGGLALDFVGSVVAKTVRLNGPYDFHADEALFRLSSPMAFLFASPDQSRSVLTGQSATLNVSAIGAAPFSYQWSLGGTVLPDATNSSLSLTNIQLTNAGSYQATITNLAGSVTSTVALLVYSSAMPTMQTPALSSNGQFQVTISGVPGFNYAIESSTNLADWVPLITNVPPCSFTETNATSFPQRYYRAVYLP